LNIVRPFDAVQHAGRPEQPTATGSTRTISPRSSPVTGPRGQGEEEEPVLPGLSVIGGSGRANSMRARPRAAGCAIV